MLQETHALGLTSSYSAWLVALSVLIAMVASYAALDMAARTTATIGRGRRLWLGGGAIAMGGGIWSMHYVGMLAFQLPIDVLYDLPLVATSLLAAILASAAALFVVSRTAMGPFSLLIGGLVMGTAIAAMHYIGMAAMRMQAHGHYDPFIVSVSVAVAIVVSIVALALAFRLRADERSFTWPRIAGAVLMGLAIAAMHYTGMAAASFSPAPSHVDVSGAVGVSSMGIAGIAAGTLAVLAIALVASLLDRRFARQTQVILAGEARHRSLIERNLAGIYWSTPSGRIVDCNAAFARMMGYPTRDALLADDTFGRYAVSDGELEFVQRLRGEGQLRDHERWLQRPDGTPVCILENASLLHQADGREVIEGTILDITERKRMEDALRARELQLRTEIAERQRMEVALHLKQRLESVGQLAAGIAHEINTPVQFVNDSVHFVRDTMQDYATLLKAHHTLLDAVAQGHDPHALANECRRLEADLDLPYLLESSPRALERALEGLERIATIVRSMKEFAHPDQREMSYVDFNRAVATTLEVARNEYKYVADVSTDLGELPAVRCYVGEINQVVLNLVVNAAHAIADGPGGQTGKGRIDVVTRQDGDEVLLEVRDSGCGIPDEIRDRIFDPFFTTKEVGRGTGQGLAISRSIVVDKHGGSMAVESAVNRGTTFTVRLPLNGRVAA